MIVDTNSYLYIYWSHDLLVLYIIQYYHRCGSPDSIVVDITVFKTAKIWFQERIVKTDRCLDDTNIRELIHIYFINSF